MLLCGSALLISGYLALHFFLFHQAKQNLIAKYEEAAKLSEEVNNMKGEIGKCYSAHICEFKFLYFSYEYTEKAGKVASNTLQPS